MLPELWGRCAWKFIHLITLNYPENPTKDDKENYHTFFYSLQYVLPCDKCGQNLTKHLKKYPLTATALANRQNLIMWAINLHNIVNYYTGKRMLTYSEALTQLQKWSTSNKQITWKTSLIIIVIIVVLCLLIWYYVKNRSGAKN